jgi:hypothetical protein
MKVTTMIRRLVVAGSLGVALAGCQGGGTSSLPTQPAPIVTATPSSPQSIKFSIAIPGKSPAAAAGLRRPLYISENTQSAAIAVNGGTPVKVNLAPGSANCQPAGTGRTCTITLDAPVGRDTFSEALYADASATGTPLSQNTTSATIVAGHANVVAIALDGVVASIALALSNAAPPIGSATSIPLTVNFNDASGAAIVGNDDFVNPITLTDSDTSGATTLSATTIDNPGDAANINVTYTGAAIASAVFGASASGVPATSVTAATLIPAAIPPPTPTTAPTATPAPPATPAPGATPAFNVWPSYGFDAGRTGFNPNTANLTPAAISNLHLAWQTTIGGSTQAQPIVLTNVAGHAALLIVASFAKAQAYDGLTGAQVWSTSLPIQSVQDCGIAGISGTPAYDASLNALFMSAGNGNGNPNHSLVYRLDAATGNVTGSVDITPTLEPGEANYTHGGITFANGRVYVGTSSDCEGTATGAYPSWRGRVVAVDPVGMSVLGTFFTTWQQPGQYAPQANYGGGGVWGWGGVSTDPAGNVFVASGNAETAAAASPQSIAAPFVAAPNEQAGYAEQLVKLSPDLSTVEGANYPGFNFAIGFGDLDYSGTPVVFQPPLTSGCGERVATQGKGGLLVVNDPSTMNVVGSFALSIPNGSAYYIGNPAYSPSTGYLYAAITSSGAGSLMLPPGLAAIGNCGSTMPWHAQFGPDSSLYTGENPRSAPTVTAGGVVFVGTPCTPNGSGGCGAPGALSGALWAVNATTGAVLNGANPIVITSDDIRMAPSADGDWIFLVDNSGNLYGLTVDPNYKPITAKAGQRVRAMLKFHHD